MAFNSKQFRKLTSAILTAYGLHSEAAVNLIMGTVAQESLFGTYLYQTEGPAIGICQMEPETFKWIKEKFRDEYPIFCEAEPEDLAHDLRLCILSARLFYKTKKSPLPKANDLRAIASYWKTHYNTRLGKGTPEEFIANYKRYCKD